VKLRQRLGMLAVAVIATTLSTAGIAAASPAASPATNTGVASSVAALSPDVAATAKGAGVAAREQALAAYWTPARMKAALPDSQLPAVRTAATATNPAAAQAKPAGPATRIAAAAPAADAPAVSAARTNATAAPLAYYPNYPVGSPVARTYGKVFFTSFGLDYVCSGTIVNTEGKSEVWTAGHCVTDGGAWNTNWTFVPNYASGSAPYGYWYASQLWSTSAWFNNNRDFADDVGSAVMYSNDGVRITDYLGGQGIAWNYPTGQYVYAFGYPQAPPFDGCCLVAENNYAYDFGDGTIYIVSDITDSGSAWLVGFDGNWGNINGHDDFKYNGYPQYMFSPYYGNQVANLYNSVRYIST